MDSDINWLHLPDIIWELILSHLDYNSLLRASVTCKKFNNVFSISKRLMKKLRLTIFDPSVEYKMKIARWKENKSMDCELEPINHCLQNSVRKYESILIRRLSDDAAKTYVEDVLIKILKHIAGSVEEIQFYDTSLKDDELFKIIQIMKNLKILKFKQHNYHIDRSVITEVVIPDIVPSINEIYLYNVRDFSFEKLYMFDNLTTLDVSDCTTDYRTLENFLSMQKHLKILRLSHLHNDSLFQTDKLATNIKFSLDELSLRRFNWSNNDNAMKFFKTQINLKKVTFGLQHLNDIDLLKLLILFFGNNLQLKTVVLSTYDYIINDFSYLESIVNPSVENLELYTNRRQNATELLIAFTKLFPNVKNFTYQIINKVHGLNQIHNWKCLEYLNCKLEDVNLILENVNIGEKLTTCTIKCSNLDDIRKPEFLAFLIRHQNIKHLTLNSDYHDNAVPDEILNLILKLLKSLKTLIWNQKIVVPCQII